MMKDEGLLEKQKNLKALCPEVQSIMFALSEYLNITFFRYVKSYPNGEKFIVCNSEAWLDEYFKEKFYNLELANYYKHPDGSKGVSIHGHCDQDHEVCEFWNRQEKVGNYNNILAFYVKFKNYFELYDFGINQDSHTSNNVFLNNQNIFRHFFLYFKSRGQQLLKQAYDNRFMVEKLENYDDKKNWMLGMNSQMSIIALSEMPLIEVFLDDEYEDHPLTLMEAKSLKFFLEGYKFSQAPNELGVSEARHIDNLQKVMTKLNITSYTDLRSLAHQRNIARKLTFLEGKKYR